MWSTSWKGRRHLQHQEGIQETQVTWLFLRHWDFYSGGAWKGSRPGAAWPQLHSRLGNQLLWGQRHAGHHIGFFEMEILRVFFFFCVEIYTGPPSIARVAERERKKKESRGSKMASRVVPTATPVCSLSALKSATGRGRPRRPDSPHHWWRNSRPLSALPSPVWRHGRFRSVLLVRLSSPAFLDHNQMCSSSPPGDMNVLQRSEIISVGPQHPAALAIHKDWACFFGGGCWSHYFHHNYVFAKKAPLPMVTCHAKTYLNLRISYGNVLKQCSAGEIFLSHSDWQHPLEPIDLCFESRFWQCLSALGTSQ